MTIKESEKENRARPRARRDNVDLRKKVLKDQTSKILNQSPCARDPKDNLPIKQKPLPRSASSPAETKTKERLLKIGCEEKTIQIRKRLEKVIHKKKDEKVALDMLMMLQQMKFTPLLLESTKICYTLEALKLVVKDVDIISKTEQTLVMLKGTEGKTAKEDKPTIPKPEIASYKEWRDVRAKEKQKELEELEKEKEAKMFEFERKKKENERRLKEIKEREERLEMKAKVLEKRKEKLLTQVQEEEITTADQAPASGEASGMRLGYWMDKLLEQVDSLNLMDKKLGNIQQTVKDLPPSDQEKKKETNEKDHKKKEETKTDELKKDKVRDGKEKEREREEKKKDGEKVEKKRDKEKEERIKHGKKKPTEAVKPRKLTAVDNKSCNMFEDELLKITQQVQCINITESSIETVSLQVDKTKVKTVQVDQHPPLLKKKSSSKSSKELKEAFAIPDKTDLEWLQEIKEMKVAIENEKDHSQMVTSLKWLQGAAMTLPILQETKIGVVVNGLRKSSPNPEVKEICKSLVLSWKKLTAAADPAKTVVEDEAKKSSGKENDKPDQVKEVRDYCRKKLMSALLTRENTPDSYKLKTEAVSKEIEREIFRMFGEPNSKYRNQVNSRYFNIRGNLVLQDNILDGRIKPSHVARMTYEELASDKIKEDREKWTKESLRSVEEKHVTDEFCTCRICLPPWIQK